jgi:hypothetical protein
MRPGVHTGLTQRTPAETRAGGRGQLEDGGALESLELIVAQGTVVRNEP